MSSEQPPGISKSALVARERDLLEVDAQPDFVGEINPNFDWGPRSFSPPFIVLKTINSFDRDGEASGEPLFDPNDRFCLRPDVAAELDRFAAAVDRLLAPKSEVSDTD